MLRQGNSTATTTIFVHKVSAAAKTLNPFMIPKNSRAMVTSIIRTTIIRTARIPG